MPRIKKIVNLDLFYHFLAYWRLELSSVGAILDIKAAICTYETGVSRYVNYNKKQRGILRIRLRSQRYFNFKRGLKNSLFLSLKL